MYSFTVPTYVCVCIHIVSVSVSVYHISVYNGSIALIDSATVLYCVPCIVCSF